MELNELILELLSILHKLGNNEINSYLKIDKDQAIIKTNNGKLLTIQKESIMLANSHNIGEHIQLQDYNKDTTFDIEKFESLLKLISNSVVRLNHVGISYTCNDIDKEIEQYNKMIINSAFKLYEENSGNKESRWFFVADQKKSYAPMFEIVLTLEQSTLVKEWTPHFQIDLDIDLTIEQLEKRMISVLGSGFDWVLNIPEYGAVLGMKPIGTYRGCKIVLGLGTNIRKVKYHRENIIKEHNPSD